MHISHVPGLLAVTLSTLAALSTAARYNTTTVINSNCPCDRRLFKYCYAYTRQEVEDDQCYTISKASRSMRIYDPFIDADSTLVCTVFGREGCQGTRSPIVAFADNGKCTEPTVELKVIDHPPGGEKPFRDPEPKETAWWYRSFKCHHA